MWPWTVRSLELRVIAVGRSEEGVAAARADTAGTGTGHFAVVALRNGLFVVVVDTDGRSWCTGGRGVVGVSGLQCAVLVSGAVCMEEVAVWVEVAQVAVGVDLPVNVVASVDKLRLI